MKRSELPDETASINLERAIQVAIELRDAQDERAAAEERLKEAKRRVVQIGEVDLVDVFNSLGIDHVGVPPSGNRAGFDVTISRFYEGGIAADWEEERKERAFDLLERYGHGGLIKSQVIVEVPRGAAKVLEKLLAFVGKLGLTPIVRKGVHPSTFKAWLKEEVESGRKMPSLAEIGGFVGERGKIKERKEG